MRKLLFFLFTIVYCYVAVYFLLMTCSGAVSDIKPKMSHAFFYYSYTTQDEYFPSNDIATTKHREFYYYLFQPIDGLVNPYCGEVRNDRME